MMNLTFVLAENFYHFLLILVVTLKKNEVVQEYGTEQTYYSFAVSFIEKDIGISYFTRGKRESSHSCRIFDCN